MGGWLSMIDLKEAVMACFKDITAKEKVT